MCHGVLRCAKWTKGTKVEFLGTKVGLREARLWPQRIVTWRISDLHGVMWGPKRFQSAKDLAGGWGGVWAKVKLLTGETQTQS